MDPGHGDSWQRHFVGLDRAPEIDSSSRGKRFLLRASTLGSLDIGSPVYYRQIQVGEVTRYSLADDGKSVEVQIFIHQPYARLVHSNSRFWNASGFNVKLDTDGIKADLESMTALLSGGVAFDTPDDLKHSKPAKDNTVFTLHASLEEIDEGSYQPDKFFVLNFDSSLRGLRKGAPVEFKGMKVGEVLDIDLVMNAKTLEVKTPVLIGLHTDRIHIDGKIPEEVHVTDTLVSRGLRAELKSGNLLTGQLYVELEFVPDAPEAKIVYHDGAYAEFPTVPAALDKITRNATELLDKVGQIPIVEISDDLRETIKGLKNIVASKQTQQSFQDLSQVIADAKTISHQLSQRVGPLTDQLDASLQQLRATLSTANDVIGEDSPLFYDLRQLIDELSSAARSFENLTDFLERHPNALLLGKPEN
ncbi:MAG TPA: MCE family protein [Gammaproteobacteria bacterium]|nr:MCE family protein [Gammaproteobacteria bacterium]